MVYPSFQKMSHGGILTRHCNAVADATSSKTFVGARCASIKMFNDNGFETFRTFNAHMERFGDKEDKSKYWYTRSMPLSDGSGWAFEIGKKGVGKGGGWDDELNGAIEKDGDGECDWMLFCLWGRR